MRTTHRRYWVFPLLFLFSAVHGGPAGRDRAAIHDVGSELDLLRHAEGMIDCDAEITDRAFEFGVYGQKLNGPQVAGLLVDLGCLRPAH
jgi:hypothetical protein